MCGIVGHAVQPENFPLVDCVRTATRRLAHRGPDGEGFVDLPQICLGHRRLGVIDLAASQQPWVSSDGRYTLVFNGEIYNYLELRHDLESLGACFRSVGDTEVLMEAYRQWGDDCLSRFNGMFAFALWDKDRRRLFLARDRVGKKQLYYAALPEANGGGLAFASELSALKVFPGVGDSLNVQAVNDYFAYQFVPFDRTIFDNAHKLPPAHCLSWDRSWR
jgi:asparagine synthase (glutamine-hydrolysing)